MNDRLGPWLADESFTYKEWEEDYKAAEDASKESTVSFQFRNAIHRLHEKQRVQDGDRSHPRLVALDQLSLTYPGWEDDVRNAERAHFDNYYDSTRDDDIYFRSKLEGLQNRQQLYTVYKAQPRRTTAGKSHDEIVAMLGACVICGERNKTHLFDPCGHLCACQSCADQLMRSSTASCPICRMQSNKVIRVFFT